MLTIWRHARGLDLPPQGPSTGDMGGLPRALNCQPAATQRSSSRTPRPSMTTRCRAVRANSLGSKARYSGHSVRCITRSLPKTASCALSANANRGNAAARVGDRLRVVNHHLSPRVRSARCDFEGRRIADVVRVRFECRTEDRDRAVSGVVAQQSALRDRLPGPRRRRLMSSTSRRNVSACSAPISPARDMKALMSFGRQPPPNPRPGFRNWPPILGSGASADASTSTSAPAASQTSAIALMNEILVARKAFAATLTSSAVSRSHEIHGIPRLSKGSYSALRSLSASADSQPTTMRSGARVSSTACPSRRNSGLQATSTARPAGAAARILD